jgi:hypothetical protein
MKNGRQGFPYGYFIFSASKIDIKMSHAPSTTKPTKTMLFSNVFAIANSGLGAQRMLLFLSSVAQDLADLYGQPDLKQASHL